MQEGIVWRFAPKGSRFEVQLLLEEEQGYVYDGDDPDGETQAKLNSGEYVAFGSCARVLLDGKVISKHWLGGSVYSADDYSDFWTAHRNPDPMNRNCTLMRAVHGDNTCICHYFPGMVRDAVRDARAAVGLMTPPKLRYY